MYANIVEELGSVTIKDNYLIFLLTSVVCLLVFKLLYTKVIDSKKYPPGPIGLPIVGYNPFLGNDHHEAFKKLSQKYGDIMSIKLGTKYTIIINEYEAFKEAVCHPASLNRSPNVFMHLDNIGFLTANGTEWQEQRRFFIHLMRDVGLARGVWNDIIQEGAQSFVKELLSKNGQPFDTTDKLNESTNNNIISLLIGRKFRKGSDDKAIQLCLDYASKALLYTGPSKLATLIPGFRKLLVNLKIGEYDKADNTFKQFSEFVKEEIKKHKGYTESSNPFDVITLYLQKMKQIKETPNSEHFFSDENLEGNVKTLFLGSSDTVFNSVTYVLRFMAKHQDIQRKVQHEIDEVVGRDGVVTYEDKARLPYTFATMMESQRVSSIVPLSTTRWVSEDFDLRGFTIPKGAEIVGNSWVMHNDPKYWDEPEKFKPERFLTDNGTKVTKNPPSFVVFSFGRRNCPGETVAWSSIMAYFCAVMQRFTVTTPPGVEVSLEFKFALVNQLEPQPLCFMERS